MFIAIRFDILQIIPFVYYIAIFLTDMGYVKDLEPLYLRALEMHVRKPS